MNRFNLALAIVVGLLIALLLWPEDVSRRQDLKTLSDIDPGGVTRIALYGGDAPQPAIVLAREEGQWWLRQPISVPADPFRVQEILALPGFASGRRLAPESVDLAALGLAPPLWRVALDETVFEIGGSETLAGQRYIRHAGTIHLVADFNPTPFDLNYADLAHRRLLPPGTHITGLTLPDGRIVGRSEPLSDPHQALARRWQQAEAQWTGRPSQMDFDAVRTRMILHFEDGHSADFLISATEPELKLIRADLDLLYRLPGSARDELLPP